MKIENKAYLDIEACDEGLTLESNEAEVYTIDIDITKEAGCRYVVPGGTIKWCTTIKNNSEIDIEDLLFRDVLAAGTSYVTGSFTVNGAHHTPTISGQTLTYHIDRIDEDDEIIICFDVNVHDIHDGGNGGDDGEDEDN